MIPFLAPEAAGQLDDIWSYIATESGSSHIADELIESITDCFLLIARHPRLGRRRDDLRPGYRSFPAGQYVILYRVAEPGVQIMHVLHGKRDIDGLMQGDR